MSVSDDVGNLFRRFGGDAGQYQEVARDDEAKQAALRWPLLNALDIAHAGPVPDAGRPVTAAAPVHRAEPAASSSAAQSEASAAAEPAAPARLPLFARGHRHATMPPPVAPAQPGANRFSPPPTVAPSPERNSAAANAPSMSAATAASSAATAVAAPTPFVPQHDAQAIPAPPFLSKRQTFASSPFNNPVPESPRAAPSTPAQQQGGSILSGLFGSKPAAQSTASAAAPSKDLSALFARLSGAPAAPARSLRDTFRSRYKADGDA
ncbi:conserved hypothetical protein [Paraburkholderia sabiae]|uniref:cellulose biosynthesis protein BcsP n=1 Tax=Paraburkholderia sabiae TaxID=273251 RepID=UPI001CB1230D|nr:cellulose biosynthesis protein BcsP [Paraburkholderia sabiae]CAG9220672.1 conserved hypothetical protein [Paraburkholderia sabiae]